MAMEGSAALRILIAVVVVGLFGIITFALAAATLGTVNKRFNDLENQIGELKGQIGNITTKPTDGTSTTATTTPTTTPKTTTSGRTNAKPDPTAMTPDTTAGRTDPTSS